MSVVDALRQAASALGSLLDAAVSLFDESREPQNPPPLAPLAKASETWPTDGHDEQRGTWPRFTGHATELGGDE